MAGARTIAAVRREAQECRDCPLWRDATQTVFGEGPTTAGLMLVGEQPGDREDREGRPFVGPAGAVLEQALEIAEIERASVYTTNAVKHFKFNERGKRRIHQRPSAAEQDVCLQWLRREIEIVSPTVAVALGATAARSLIGRPTAIGANRGRVLEGTLFSPVIVTAHPSSVLRQRDHELRHDALQAIADDLRLAARVAAGAEQMTIVAPP
ncbi:MAG TPA: UdgX family uracil-DNA binding protein [Solirubrobacteraceae bacterium]|jgi:DNA polymerase|nr:UdgX family uracil-DNA binding protein [Solirubrobacteraceae bacterium]